MPKKLLFIESDAAFAGPLATVLSSHGFEVQVVADGFHGIDAARGAPPDAFVLSAELPRSSGFAVCNKIKKDRALGAIPVILTSATATAETFEQHRRLKTRADDYLSKPFAAEALVEKLVALLGAVDAPAENAEVVTLDDVEEIDATIAALDAAAVDPGLAAADDDDLRALDEAFESIAGPPAPPVPPQPIAAAAPEPEPAPEPAPELETAAAASALADRDAEIARLQDRVSELLVEAGRATDECARLQGELDRAGRDLEEARRRIADLEARLSTHEQRVVKAYQRLKSDEKAREKARKAIAVALQILDDGVPADAPAPAAEVSAPPARR